MPDKRDSDYSDCWANCLGDCDEGMSREHLLSKCLFEREIRVKGFPWCKDTEKAIGIEGLTAKFLCRHHNSTLSELDAAARHTLDTLLEAYKLFETRKNIVTTRWTVKYFATDMLLLERWCLKTLININLSGKPGLPVDDEGKTSRPTDELVRIVFGLDRFKPPMGLYRIVVIGENIDLGDWHIQITTKGREGRLGAAEFTLWGMRFFLSLIPESIRWEGGTLMRGEHKQWFNTWDRKKRRVNSHLVTFTYPK
jgi:hypothetical protein